MRKYLSPLQKQQLMVRTEQHIVNGNDQNYPIENYVSFFSFSLLFLVVAEAERRRKVY